MAWGQLCLITLEKIGNLQTRPIISVPLSPWPADGAAAMAYDIMHSLSLHQRSSCADIGVDQVMTLADWLLAEMGANA